MDVRKNLVSNSLFFLISDVESKIWLHGRTIVSMVLYVNSIKDTFASPSQWLLRTYTNRVPILHFSLMY
mgnify:CR=1 FL=1